MSGAADIDVSGVVGWWPQLEGAEIAPAMAGNINATWLVGPRYVLQRQHPAFSAAVNEDIAVITAHARRAGVPLPELVRTREGQSCVVVADGALAGTWRVLTRLPGLSHHTLQSVGQARAAGALLGRFHSALRDLRYDFAFTRPHAHDTERHMGVLREALEAHRRHRLHAEVAAVGGELLQRWRDFGPLPELPKRIGHGDMKISNVLFAEDDPERPTGLIDLDTMAWMRLDRELGDALRSWCNRGREDDPEPSFDVAVFEAAMAGWLGEVRGWIAPIEATSVVSGLLRVCLELSARFAGDALNEAYFGWDPAIASGPGEHHLMRAKNQLGLARLVDAQRSALEARVDALCG